ncbi:MAG: DUF3450 family protein [Planctomycetes bacterium]|nr:DUF3450 family protein [Planctomycetota bacterium]
MNYRSKLSALIAGLALSCGVIATLGANARQDTQGSTADKLSTTRAALEKLTEIEKAISAEKRDWMLKKELIEERMNLLRDEAATLEKQTTEIQAKITESDKSTGELSEKVASFASGNEVIEASIGELETRVRAIAKRLPLVARERIESILAAMPKEGAETKLGIAARFSFVAGCLKLINRFHEEITTAPEIRVASDGRSVAVTTVYFGCGQAFYSDESGSVAGIGTSTNGEWTWIPKTESGEAIKKLVDIAKGKKTAEYVSVPVRIQ